MADWYERQNELEPDQIFRMYDGSVVKLDRGVPGDGTAWYVANWNNYANGWTYDDGRIEPCDLTDRLPDNWNGEPPSGAA